MTFTLLPCLALCLASGPDAKLEITTPRPTYGYLGAPRPTGADGGALPGDTVYFQFEIKNLKLDEAGKAMYSIAIEIRDEQDKLIFEQKPYNSVAQNFLGGNRLPCAAHVHIPLDAKPGAVSWKITIKDRAAGTTASVSGKGKVLPADFGIVNVGLFADPEARVPTSAMGVIGDSFYLQFSLVGFGRDKDKNPDVRVSMRILDANGKPTMAKPLEGKVNSGVGANVEYIPLQFGMTLNRAGRFTIELTATDGVSNKKSTVRYQIRVLDLAP
jgi:hypothetical protein